jgi:predicted ATPase
MNDNYFILTGAMGSGKSTILKLLQKQAFTCVEEPARKILKEQRGIHGQGTPEKNPELFTNLLLSRSISQYESMLNTSKPVIFDRGIPDKVGYADIFGVDVQPFISASNQYRYNRHVFFLPAWKEIYRTDDERKMSFKQAHSFGDKIREIYTDLGYQLIDVPLGSPTSRAEFVMKTIKRLKKKLTNLRP